MIVVADAAPLHYLVLIGSVDILKPLYDRVFVPQAVARELQHAGAPDSVRKWIAQPPHWCEIRPDLPSDPSLEFLGPGERAAITLALSVDADRLLIDEWEGRVEAERRYLHVTGTLGVLAEAHRQHLLDFEAAVARLRQTTFYMSAELINSLRRHLSTGRGDL
jgi:predicted nucleic acid-binding protein